MNMPLRSGASDPTADLSPLAGGAPEPVTAPIDAESLWEQAARLLQSEVVDGNSWSAWFDRTRALRIEGGTFLLGTPTRFNKEWIEARYLDALRAAVSRSAGRDLDVALVTSPALDDAEPPRAEVPPEPGRPSPVADAGRADGDDVASFIPKYGFDSFVIGSSNRFAHAAALAVAEVPVDAYNPLFIYGGAGLGKTHLLHAIGRYVKEWHDGLVVRYVTTEQFMNEFIRALRSNSIPQFHSRYRAADVLLIDDIQFLEGKERTQEEFFHTFNALHPASQIVISSDRMPKKVLTLEERLRTRFEWGLITDIQPPDLETRLAILQKKVEADRLPVPPEVMSFIAGRIQTNIRELEGALIRVAAYASLTRSHVTLDLAQNILQSLFPEASEARVSTDLVISVAADYFGVTPDEIRSPSRSRPLVTARQIAMYLCRELTDLSLPRIGETFGGRDHSTVVHATKKVRSEMHESQSSYEQVRELTERIRQRATRG